MTEFEEQAARLRKPARGTAQAERKARRRTVDAAEEKAKREVRKRDKVCRFPLCECRKRKLRLEVAHRRHKGMGGNPAGDRSDARGMVLLCFVRHRGHLSVDDGTFLWEPLYESQGANGPIMWFLNVDGKPRFIATERTAGGLEPLSGDARRYFQGLADSLP